MAIPSQLAPSLHELLSLWGCHLADSLGFPLQAPVGGPPDRPDCVAGFGHWQKPRAAHLIRWLLLFGAVPVCLLQASRCGTCFRWNLTISPLTGGAPSLHPALENKHFVPLGIFFSGGSGSPAELGTACGVELVGWIDPKATSLLIFPLLSFPLPNPGLPCIASVLFGQTQKPSTRPTPGLQVPWKLWSEVIKVLVAFSPNCCYALASRSILLLQSVIEQTVSV